MKITIYGVGAVGGLIAGRIAATGEDVAAIARGPTLAALQAHGIRWTEDGQQRSARLHAVADPAALGVQDLVVIAMKAPQLDAVAATIAPLIGPHTLVMPAMNGVPWWFFDHPGVPHAGLRLPSLQSHDRLAAAIPLDRILGCVVHLSASCPRPGEVRLGFGNRLLVGAAGSAPAGAAQDVVRLLAHAGFDAVASDDIRRDIWYKLWGNMTVNPISVLTGATTDRILADPLVTRFCLDAMAEAAAIGARIGCPIAQTGAERLDVARQLGAFKSSMLQDAEAGKRLEIDALVTIVHEIGQAVGVATPAVDRLLGLIRLHGRCHGIHPD